MKTVINVDQVIKKKTLHDIKKNGLFKCNIARLNIMADKIYKQPKDVYEFIEEYGGDPDSYTRETIFSYLSEKYDAGNYDLIFDRWLGGY
jgi:hypothetical protein